MRLWWELSNLWLEAERGRAHPSPGGGGVSVEDVEAEDEEDGGLGLAAGDGACADLAALAAFCRRSTERTQMRAPIMRVMRMALTMRKVSMTRKEKLRAVCAAAGIRQLRLRRWRGILLDAMATQAERCRRA
jgi:hypothetical protein